MTRARLSLISGIVLLVVACLLPCRTLAEWAAVSLPYQDPTPDMLADQAAEVAALEGALVTYLSISAVLVILGVCASAYGLRPWWRGRRGKQPTAR